MLRLYVRVRGVSSVWLAYSGSGADPSPARSRAWIIQAALLRFGSGWHVVGEAVGGEVPEACFTQDAFLLHKALALGCVAKGTPRHPARRRASL